MKARRHAAALLVVALATAGCGSDDDPTLDAGPPPGAADTSSTTGADGATTSSSTPATTAAIRTIEIRIEKGAVVGGARRESVALGSKVRIVAIADVAEELHVHTYELRVDLEPDVPGEVVFDAGIPGRHEVEFEKAHKEALILEVK